MQQSSREMQGMAFPLNGISPSAGVAAAAAQISLQDLHNGHRQHQIQNAGLQLPASHFEDHPSAVGGDAGGHDDFFDQMLSSLPSSWPDLGNPKSPWDLTSSSNPSGLARKSPEESAAADGLHYAPYDESALLASRLHGQQPAPWSPSSSSGRPAPGRDHPKCSRPRQLHSWPWEAPAPSSSYPRCLGPPPTSF